MNNTIGWILWKLKLAVRIMDDIDLDGDFYIDSTGIHIDYIPKTWHYEWGPY